MIILLTEKHVSDGSEGSFSLLAGPPRGRMPQFGEGET